jgi:hypothetical protein
MKRPRSKEARPAAGFSFWQRRSSLVIVRPALCVYLRGSYDRDYI